MHQFDNLFYGILLDVSKYIFFQNGLLPKWWLISVTFSSSSIHVDIDAVF